MDFTKWLESRGFTVDALNEQQTKCLRMIFDAQAGKPRQTKPKAIGWCDLQLIEAAVRRVDTVRLI
jgi:hypothetical protein